MRSTETHRKHKFLIRLRALVHQHRATLVHSPGRYKIKRGDLTLTVKHDPGDPEGELTRIEKALSKASERIAERVARGRHIREQAPTEPPRRRRRRRAQP
ncbi:hypothetical protein [Ruegeria atlantica]|uniref:hypothetical protein n=1 Tax=Ruegeria atlantica TaxID=81569 RepID=UPI002495765F|nr:hypothetical protein [Ruegeria atlantica]